MNVLSTLHTSSQVDSLNMNSTNKTKYEMFYSNVFSVYFSKNKTAIGILFKANTYFLNSSLTFSNPLCFEETLPRLFKNLVLQLLGKAPDSIQTLN